MMTELPNHLLPWDTVKKLLKQAKRDAWEEGHEATCEAHDFYGGLNYTPPNPYQEDE